MSYPVMSTAIPWSLVKGGFRKTPHFNSLVQKTAAGRGTSTLALQPYATWDFEVDLNCVLGGEAFAGSVLQSFLGCYMAACGGGGYFTFTDPNDNLVLGTTVLSYLLLEDGSRIILEDGSGFLATDDPGTVYSGGVMLNVTPGAASPMGQGGDGTSKVFQLARSMDQAVDILQNVSNVAVTVNGAAKVLGADYSISSTGVLTFVAAPPNGATLAWSGSFQYLCRFVDDSLKDLARVNKSGSGFLWSCSSIQFESIFL